MKSTIFFFAFTFTFFSKGQIVKSDSILFRECNLIEIASNLTNEELYKIAGYQLIANGMVIDNATKDFFSIIASPFQNNFGRKIKFNVFINEQKIRLKAVFLSSENNLTSQVRNTNGRFSELVSLAKKFNEAANGKIYYIEEVARDF